MAFDLHLFGKKCEIAFDLFLLGAKGEMAFDQLFFGRTVWILGHRDMSRIIMG